MREKNSERPDTRDNRSKNSTKTGKKKKNTKNREFAVITYSFLALFICLMGYFSYFQFLRARNLSIILIIPDRRHLHRRSCAGRF